uniref:L1 transposable element RRM domain-containing protein n=1 Tax=Sus scrofa TaxID=9823 RepID=A0A8D1RJH2_PIG
MLHFHQHYAKSFNFSTFLPILVIFCILKIIIIAILVSMKWYKIQEAQRAPNKLNPNRPTPRHIIIKMAKVSDKERILKAAREKQNVTYKGTPIRISADFSTETLQARREWQEIFKVLKGKNMQPRILYPARISFKIEGEIKIFSNKQKLKEYSNTKPRLKEILKGLL